MTKDEGGIRKRPLLKIEGKIMNKINPGDRRWCQTSRDRYDEAFTMKKEKNPKRTLFTPTIPVVEMDGTIVHKTIEIPAKQKKLKK